MASNLASQLFQSANGVSDSERGGSLRNETGSAATQPLKVMRSDRGMVVALDDAAQTLTLSDGEGRNLITIFVRNGQIKVQADNKVIVEAPQIELGEYAAHPVAFGDQLLDYLNRMVDTFNTHMHTGQASGDVAVTPRPPESPIPRATPFELLSGQVKTG